MSGINRQAEKIKKKMKLKDHQPLKHHDVNTSKRQKQGGSANQKGKSLPAISFISGGEEGVYENININTSKNKEVDTFKGVKANTFTPHDGDTSKGLNAEKLKQQNANVKKTTIYFSEEVLHKFNEIYAKRILKHNKTDKSDLINEAVELLYSKEFFE